MKPQDIHKLMHDAALMLNKTGVAGAAQKRILESFITQDPDMLLLKKQARHLSTKDVPVLIEGETGTGKELIAQILHTGKLGRLVAVNCAGISPQLLESEFFGHKKGSFTGAFTDRVGHFEMANNGTLFLDEIGELPIDLQAKLLRVLETKTITRVGESDERPINCRIVAATNRNLLEYSSFRNDLYYRLSVIVLKTKPLRDRKDDIPLLINKFLKDEGANFNSIYGDNLVKARNYAVHGQFSNEYAYNAIMNEECVKNWPGNIRELKNYITRKLIFAEMEKDEITN